MIGFSYNGKHCEELGVHYIPNDTQRGDIMSAFEVMDKEKNWHPGSDLYGVRIKSRTWDLNCYYEDVTAKELEAITRWLDGRTRGELIFDDRPWAVYQAHPTKVITIKNYSRGYGKDRRYSGTFTAYFTAEYPFAELKYIYANNAPLEISNEVDLLMEAETPPQIVTNMTSCLVYNPGTEIGQSRITFQGSIGSSAQTVITNTTTGDKLFIQTGYQATGSNSIVFDSKLGRVDRYTSNGKQLLFECHGGDYIHFAPNRFLRESVTVSGSNGSNVVTSAGAFTEELVGAYVFLGNQWRELTGFTDASHMTISANLSADVRERTKIVTMNELIISKGSDANITNLVIECLPEVR